MIPFGYPAARLTATWSTTRQLRAHLRDIEDLMPLLDCLHPNATDPGHLTRVSGLLAGILAREARLRFAAYIDLVAARLRLLTTT